VVGDGLEIVLDHSFSGWPQERHLEAVCVPASDDDIVARFGAEALSAVQWLQARGLPHPQSAAT
jgi:hypothetical protein